MTDRKRTPEQAIQGLRTPLRLTRLGMGAERLMLAFWPLWSLIFIGLAALMLGGLAVLPLEAAWVAVTFGGLTSLLALARGLKQFRLPSRSEARARLDATLPGRPIAALSDTQAIGAGDVASEAIWSVHLARMEARAAQAKAVQPELRLSRQDPYALRYVAVLALMVALLFGSLWRVAQVADLASGSGGAALAGGPSWEGWIEPPRYTGKPSLYLNDIPSGPLRVPEGSQLTLRLYGDLGALTVAETVSRRTGEIPSASDPSQRFTVRQSGDLSINGSGAEAVAAWKFIMVPDKAPDVQLSAPEETTLAGELRQPFYARDDYGIQSGQAVIALDLGAVVRRHGLSVEPEPRDKITLDLPLTITGDRSGFEEVLIDNFAKHPWAGLPITLSLSVVDALDQTGESATGHMTLPGRRFFDPLAQAVIEQRRDLLWSRDNGRRVAQVLRAVTYEPVGLFDSETTYLKLRIVIRRLERVVAQGMTPEHQVEYAAVLWDIAVQLEDGDLSDALERLRRAQDRLSEAMRQGASDSEIAELMQELRDAMQDYFQQLAQEALDNPQDQQQAENQNNQEITGDQLQAMLDRIQELMEQGRMAEAQQLLDQLRQMMENMQVTQGQQGNQQSPGQQALEGLADTLRQQQGLSDQAFRDLQEQFNPGAQAGQSGENEGQNGGLGQGQSHEGQGGEGEGAGDSPGQQPGNPTAQALADRQQALRNQLARQRQNLPGAGTPGGETTREALDQAGEAMDQAEDALRQDDLAGALDRQADAMEALREGMRELGEQLAEQQRGQGQQDDALGEANPLARDPLGREAGALGAIGTDEQLLQGEDVYRQARELLDEIRKRSGDQARPELERNYLKRLLDRF